MSCLFGAIIGDIAGSKYEHISFKEKPSRLYDKEHFFSDDTVMTLAIACALLKKNTSDNDIKQEFLKSCRVWGEAFPYAGYGTMFKKWLFSKTNEPYNSFGNGSAMRVSPIAWFYDDLDTVLNVSKLSAEISHNHKEGIKGAQAIASATFLARIGKSKNEIKDYIESTFEYDLSRTCDEIRPNYKFESSCQKSVPEAIISFLESESFEEAIFLSISLGGDADTLACMAGSIAWAFYKPDPNKYREQLQRFEFLPEEMWFMIDKFGK